jgi:hypothetical protein
MSFGVKILKNKIEKYLEDENLLSSNPAIYSILMEILSDIKNL